MTGCKQSETETIVFFRHGEKPKLGLGQLTCQGLNRALSLPQVLNEKFGKPDIMFAPNPNGMVSERKGIYYYVRPLITIMPTAINLKVPINTLYAQNDTFSLAQELLTTKYRNATVFVSWEHKKLVKIMKDIMTLTNNNPKLIPSWDCDDMDSLYILTLKWSDDFARAMFMTGSENLNKQPTQCPNLLTINNHSTSLKIENQKVTRYIIIPAAENANEIPGILSCKGLNRSLALANFLKQKYSKIDYFFAPSPYARLMSNTNNVYPDLRSLMTIAPAAIISSKDLELPFASFDIDRLVQYLLSSKYKNSSTVIVWPEELIPKLVKTLYRKSTGTRFTQKIDEKRITEIKIDPTSTKVIEFLNYDANLRDLKEIC